MRHRLSVVVPVQALYTNAIGACIAAVFAVVASGAGLEALYASLAMQGWWLEIYMGVTGARPVVRL